MSGDGYDAIVKAAAKIACSPIVDRSVREKAQQFLSTEIDRWDETVADEPEADDATQE